MKISKNISFEEAFKSQSAIRHKIDNTTKDVEIIENMKYVAELFELIRNHFKVPIGISSFYRSPKLNAIIGGSKNSQHIKGEAIDIDADIFGKITNKQIFDFAQSLDFDQLIWEYGDDKNPAWVHISRVRNGKNRRRITYIK